jgi:hypothetical protein
MSAQPGTPSESSTSARNFSDQSLWTASDSSRQLCMSIPFLRNKSKKTPTISGSRAKTRALKLASDAAAFGFSRRSASSIASRHSLMIQRCLAYVTSAPADAPSRKMPVTANGSVNLPRRTSSGDCQVPATTSKPVQSWAGIMG